MDQVHLSGGGAGEQRTRSFVSQGIVALLVTGLGAATLAMRADAAGDDLQLRVGEMRTLAVEGLERVAISQPTVIDIGIVSQDQVLVKALAAGTSDLLIWDQHGQRKLSVLVEDPTIDEQLEQLQHLLNTPDFRGVTVSREGRHLFVGGTLPSTGAQQRLESILSAFPDVTNATTLKSEQESNTLIEMDVQVVEVNRTNLEKLGIKWSEAQTFTETVYPRVGPEGASFAGRIKPAFKFGALQRLGSGSTTAGLSGIMNALVRNGLGRVLAQPRLVTRSGKAATSFVGGQVPILTTTTTGLSSGAVSSTIEFKDFGVSLTITPTLSDDEQIITTNMQAEVSSIDSSTAITISGVTVPGFKVRRAQTEIATAPEETIFIAGLVQQEESSSVDAVPGLGAVPVLGRLFKSPEFKSGQTELVITVTPHLTRQAAVATAAAQEATATPPTAQDDVLAYALQVRQQLAQVMESQPITATQPGRHQATLRLHLFADGSLGQVVIGQPSGDEQLDADLMAIAEQEAPYPPFPSTLRSADLWVEVPVEIEGHLPANEG